MVDPNELNSCENGCRVRQVGGELQIHYSVIRHLHSVNKKEAGLIHVGRTTDP